MPAVGQARIGPKQMVLLIGHHMLSAHRNDLVAAGARIGLLVGCHRAHHPGAISAGDRAGSATQHRVYVQFGMRLIVWPFPTLAW